MELVKISLYRYCVVLNETFAFYLLFFGLVSCSNCEVKVMVGVVEAMIAL